MTAKTPKIYISAINKKKFSIGDYAQILTTRPVCHCVSDQLSHLVTTPDSNTPHDTIKYVMPCNALQ
jgi:hypothetical protein